MEAWKDKLRDFVSLRAASADEWFTPGRFAALLALLFLGQYPGVLLGGQSFVLRDYGLYSFPVAAHWRESFWQGELPLWNPLNNCGLPFLAQWSTLVLYPPTLGYMFLPLTWALPAFCMAHLAWGGLGVFFLTRRWTGSATAGAVAGVVFAFNTLFINSLVWPHYCVAIGWMPWIVLAAERGLREGGRRVLWAVAAGAMQMLSGMPEIILLTWLLVTGMAGWLLLRGTAPPLRVLAGFAAQVTLVAALCAPQIAPFLQLMAESHRSVGFADDRWSMPGTGFANFLVPLFYSYSSRGGVFYQYYQHLVSSYYAGVALVWLALLGILAWRGARVGGLTAASGVCLLLALGENGFLFPLLKAGVPALSVARYPVKFLYLFMLTACLLAGFGLASYTRRATGKPPLGALGQGVLLGVLLLLMAGLVWFAEANPMPRDTPGATLRSALSRAAILAATVALLWQLVRTASVARGVLGRLALLALVWFDLRTQGPPIMPSIPAKVFEQGMIRRDVPLDPFPAHGRARLMLKPDVDMELHFAAVSDPEKEFLVNRATFFSNCNLLDGVSKVNGFYSLLLKRHEDVFSRFYRQSFEGAGLKDFMGVAQYTDPNNQLEWKPRATHLPLLTAGQRPEFATPAATLAGIFRDDFNPTQVVYLPLEARQVVGVATDGAVRIVSSRVGSHRVEAEVEADQAGLLVIAQCHYPSWRAHVNDARVPLLPANHAFQAVPVPAGRSRVSVIYTDKPFLLGGAASATVLCLCLAGMRWGRNGTG